MKRSSENSYTAEKALLKAVPLGRRVQKDEVKRHKITRNMPATDNPKPYSTDVIEVFMRLSDIIAILTGAGVSFLFYHERIAEDMLQTYFSVIAVTLILSSFTISLTGGYDTRAYFSFKNSFQTVLMGWIITIFLLLFAGFSFKITDLFSRLWVGNWFIAASAFLIVFRAVICITAIRLRQKKTFNSRAVIVGAGRQGRELYKFIKGHKLLTISVIGFADDRTDRVPDVLDGVPVIGGLDALVKLIRSDKVDQVLVSLPWSAKERLHHIVESIAENPVKIRLAPDLAVFEYLNRDFTFLGELPVMNLFDRPISGFDSLVKMIEDYALATFFLLILSPLMLMIAVAIKLDSEGPIFFRQEREGFNNKKFKVWKFRSMKVSEQDEIVQVSASDSRVTRVGSFLRKTSLDELPQLINVLAGDMSLVGPRPHAPSTRAGGVQFKEAVKRYAARHRVKPGMTGWAQVNGWRGETDTIEKLEKRLHHDLYYIDHWSLLLDLKILIRTAWVIWRQNTAY